MSLEKTLDAIAEADLRELIQNQVPESRTLDYKLTLPGGTDEQKKEFLADVSSFANTSGGHIIYGIREQNGIATELPGIAVNNPDAEITRLENDGIIVA